MPDQVCARVTDDLQPLLIFWSDDLHTGIALDQITGIDQPTIYLARERRLGKPRTDGLRNLRNGHRMIERTLTAVRKSNGGHGASSPSGDPYQRPHGLG